jgi:hypothetical protein
MNQGQTESAHTHLSTSLALARTRQLSPRIVAVQIALAELYIRHCQWKAAEAALAEARHTVSEMNTREKLPHIYRCMAQIRLAKNDPSTALADAECAASIARELGDALAEGRARRILGVALYAAGHTAEADAAFKSSLGLLEARDEYEIGRTLAQWAALLPDAEATSRAAMRDSARDIFARLGAQRDLAAVEEAPAEAGGQHCV